MIFAGNVLTQYFNVPVGLQLVIILPGLKQVQVQVQVPLICHVKTAGLKILLLAGNATPVAGSVSNLYLFEYTMTQRV